MLKVLWFLWKFNYKFSISWEKKRTREKRENESELLKERKIERPLMSTVELLFCRCNQEISMSERTQKRSLWSLENMFDRDVKSDWEATSKKRRMKKFKNEIWSSRPHQGVHRPSIKFPPPKKNAKNHGGKSQKSRDEISKSCLTSQVLCITSMKKWENEE